MDCKESLNVYLFLGNLLAELRRMKRGHVGGVLSARISGFRGLAKSVNTSFRPFLSSILLLDCAQKIPGVSLIAY